MWKIPWKIPWFEVLSGDGGCGAMVGRGVGVTLCSVFVKISVTATVVLSTFLVEEEEEEEAVDDDDDDDAAKLEVATSPTSPAHTPRKSRNANPSTAHATSPKNLTLTKSAILNTSRPSTAGLVQGSDTEISNPLFPSFSASPRTAAKKSEKYGSVGGTNSPSWRLTTELGRIVVLTNNSNPSNATPRALMGIPPNFLAPLAVALPVL